MSNPFVADLYLDLLARCLTRDVFLDGEVRNVDSPCRASGTDDGEGWGDPPVDERRSRLSKVAPKGSRFTTFTTSVTTGSTGSRWRTSCRSNRRRRTRGVSPADAPRPPEDVGGTWGYAEFLEAVADPRHKEHEQTLDWAGGSFDPDLCDLVDINESLTPIRR